MSEPNPSFETRLEWMERRLADIQRELAPEPPPRRESEEPPRSGPIPLRPRSTERPGSRRAPPAPEAPATEPARVTPELELLGTLYANVLGSVRRLLDGYEAALRRLSHAPSRASAGGVEVTAGPFGDTAALREFERALAKLPGVCDVSLRGYQSGDRAILEVQLERETT